MYPLVLLEGGSVIEKEQMENLQYNSLNYVIGTRI